ncbi:MAG TPA: hypothetical protein VG496_17915 [Myxococcales bacterium]|nr:hypothetical protein [Myxococcales bacterium]
MVAHSVSSDAYPRFTLINRSAAVNGRVATVAHGDVMPMPSGFLRWSFMQFRGTDEEQSLDKIGDAGGPAGSGGSFLFLYTPREQVFAVDVNGGAALAGTLSLKDQRNRRRVMMFEASGAIRWGPRDLATDSAVVGLGVDVNGRTLAIQDGTARCTGCIVAQWFDRDGATLTGQFTMLTGFSAGPATWFEVAPLIDGGLAVRRMDALRSGQTQVFRSQWLATVDSGRDTTQSAPDWMKARPDTNLALARAGTAYAVLPNGASSQPCSQNVELMSRSGKSCAKWTLDIAGARTCDTIDVRLGLDGTILQRLPFELETTGDGSRSMKSCTVRFWPAALK